LLNMYSFLNILSFVFNALESAYLHQINNANLTYPWSKIREALQGDLHSGGE